MPITYLVIVDASGYSPPHAKTKYCTSVAEIEKKKVIPTMAQAGH